MGTNRCSAVLVMLCAAGAVHAQPTPPPAGAINHVYKSLTEVEPRTVINQANTPGDADSIFRITAPGSYYLDRAHLFTAAQITGKAGIEIDSDDVTIDMNGFVLSGNSAFPTVGRQGIFINGARENIVIKNGSLVVWGLGGIVGASADQVTIENVSMDTVCKTAGTGPAIQLNLNGIIRGCRVEDCENNARGIVVNSSSTIIDATVTQILATSFDGGGITINGEGCTIRNALVKETTGVGITAGANAVAMQDCTVRGGSAQGVVCGNDSTLTRVQSFNNAGIGLSVGACSTVSECTANNNGGTGISIGANSKVINSSSCVNTGSGVSTGSGCVVTGSTANLNTVSGFATGNGNTVSNCTAADNTIDGFDCGQENTVNTCTATGNDQDGFDMFDSGRIYGCTASGNNVHGIRLSADTLCRDNNCEANGGGSGVVDGSGIFSASNDNRIDSNSVIENDVGINCTGSGMIIMRNSATGNTTNYSLAAGNTIGTILVLTGGLDITTTNSYANFEY